MASSVKDIHLYGVVASRPAASSGNEGYFYFATDVDGGTLYRSNGSSWDSLAPGISLGDGGALLAANNLSDLANAGTARTNLGLGSAATHAATDFNSRSNNLSDVADVPTARTNLGLGTAVLADTGDFADSATQTEVEDARDSSTFGVYTSLDARLEAIESALASVGIYPTSGDFSPRLYFSPTYNSMYVPLF